MDLPPQEMKPVGTQSPQPLEPQDCGPEDSGEVGLEGAVDPPPPDPPVPSYPSWVKSPEGGGLSFSTVNSNLRDLTPSHTLEPGAFRADSGLSFREGGLFYTCADEGGTLAMARSLGGDLLTHTPPQKKKVRSD